MARGNADEHLCAAEGEWIEIPGEVLSWGPDGLPVWRGDKKRVLNVPDVAAGGGPDYPARVDAATLELRREMWREYNEAADAAEAAVPDSEEYRAAKATADRSFLLWEETYSAPEAKQKKGPGPPRTGKKRKKQKASEGRGGESGGGDGGAGASTARPVPEVIKSIRRIKSEQKRKGRTSDFEDTVPGIEKKQESTVNPTAFGRNIEARRQAAQQLEAEERRRQQEEATETASGIQVGGTLLGALLGAIATGGNPAGAAAGASIGGGLGTGAAGVIAPEAVSPGQAAMGVERGARGIAGIDELLRRLSVEEDLL